jgi:hypothetical protein
MKQRTLVKPGAREQMEADLGTTQQNLVALLRLLYRVHPKRSDGGDSVSAARDMERAMPLRQRSYASLSATMVAALLTLLCYGALPAVSNASSSLPVQGRLEPPQPSESPTASETAAQQSQGLKRLAQRSQEEQVSPKEEPQPQAEQTRGSRPGVEIMLPGGKVEAVLAWEVPRGFNIALVALGGKVERTTSEYNDRTWAAANVIDGTVSIREGGWASKDSTLPQELVFSFDQTREALITAVVIDTTTAETLRQPYKMPKHVEVWTSTTSPTDGFSRIAGARLQHRTAEQVIMLPPTRAKYVDKKLYTLYRPQWMAQCAGGIQ